MQTVKTTYFHYGQKEIDYLKLADPVLGEAMDLVGKVERVVIPDLFAALIYAIIGQLISAKSVHTIWNRMQEQFGEITASNLSNQTAEDIQKCGMTMKKAICIIDISQTIYKGEFNLQELYNLPDNEVIEQLTKLKGIGTWTAQMLLLNSMERPDVVSYDDIAIRRGLCKVYGLDKITKQQFESYRSNYSPYGSVASIYLWYLSF